jgi:hypothetical protein
VVVPLWFIIIALYGLSRAKPLGDAALWLTPTLLAAVVPPLLAYAEPRVLLPLAPAACILAAGACGHSRELLERWSGRGARLGMLVPAAIVLVLAVPTVRDAARAWAQKTPLQQIASARRGVGAHLARNLPPEGRIVSLNPAVAIWAHRDWRVLPYDDLDRIVSYAQAQGAGTIVFSTFDSFSPLRDQPRAFVAMLLGPGVRASGAQLRLEPVESTPLLFVGRLTGAAP